MNIEKSVVISNRAKLNELKALGRLNSEQPSCYPPSDLTFTINDHLNVQIQGSPTHTLTHTAFTVASTHPRTLPSNNPIAIINQSINTALTGPGSVHRAWPSLPYLLTFSWLVPAVVGPRPLPQRLSLILAPLLWHIPLQQITNTGLCGAKVVAGCDTTSVSGRTLS